MPVSLCGVRVEHLDTLSMHASWLTWRSGPHAKLCRYKTQHLKCIIHSCTCQAQVQHMHACKKDVDSMQQQVTFLESRQEPTATHTCMSASRVYALNALAPQKEKLASTIAGNMLLDINKTIQIGARTSSPKVMSQEENHCSIMESARAAASSHPTQACAGLRSLCSQTAGQPMGAPRYAWTRD